MANGQTGIKGPAAPSSLPTRPISFNLVGDDPTLIAVTNYQAFITDPNTGQQIPNPQSFADYLTQYIPAFFNGLVIDYLAYLAAEAARQQVISQNQGQVQG